MTVQPGKLLARRPESCRTNQKFCKRSAGAADRLAMQSTPPFDTLPDGRIHRIGMAGYSSQIASVIHGKNLVFPSCGPHPVLAHSTHALLGPRFARILEQSFNAAPGSFMSNTRHITGLAATCLLLGSAVALLGHAADADQTFDNGIAQLRLTCDGAPSIACSKAVHEYLDTNRDSRITLSEVQATRSRATSAVQDRENSLTAEERMLVGLALIGMKSAGEAQVFENFDVDGDGGLSHDELFADVQLDKRPFAVLVNDPDGVNWQMLAGRFGTFGRSLVGMLPANETGPRGPSPAPAAPE